MSVPHPEASRSSDRAARLRAMGGVLHEAGGDEEPEGAPTATGQDPAEALLRREVPPHHGG